MQEQSSLNEIPARAAAFGSKLVSVQPGIVLISRQYGSPSGEMRKSMRERVRAQMALNASNAW
jgi:hypothetical protein